MAIVTVGGICPGLNDVVRSLVHKVSGGWAACASLAAAPLVCLPSSLVLTLPPSCPPATPHTHTLRSRSTTACPRATSWACATASRGFTTGATSR